MNPCTREPVDPPYDYHKAKFDNLGKSFEILNTLVARGAKLSSSTDSSFSSVKSGKLSAEDATGKVLEIVNRLIPNQPRKVQKIPNQQRGVQKTKSLTNRIWTKIVESKPVSKIIVVAKVAILYLSLLGSALKCILPSNRWSNLIQRKTVKIGEGKYKTTHLYLGGMPAFRSQRPNTRYISLLKDYEAHRPLIREGVKNSTSRFPSPDFQAVSIEQIDQGVQAVLEHMNDNDVYLHCKAGYGRSGAIAVAYMMTQLPGEFKDVQERYEAAYQYVKKQRPQLNVHKSELNIRNWYEVRPKENPMNTGPVTKM